MPRSPSCCLTRPFHCWTAIGWSCGILRRAISIAAYAASMSMCAIVRSGFLAGGCSDES